MNDFSHELLDFTDAWEHDFTEYDFRYLWNLQAIVHGTADYTAQKTSAEVPAAA